MEKQYKLYLQEYKEMLKHWKKWQQKELDRYEKELEDEKKLELKK